MAPTPLLDPPAPGKAKTTSSKHAASSVVEAASSMPPSRQSPSRRSSVEVLLFALILGVTCLLVLNIYGIQNSDEYSRQSELIAKHYHEPKNNSAVIGDEEKFQTPTKPLNVIIFYPDDWRHDDLGGVVSILQTPFLSELAAKGIRFTYNAVTTSICWISRATLFTGQWVSRHGSTKLFRPYFAVKPERWKHTWPFLLQKAGYFVGHVGKWQYNNQKGYQERLFNHSKMYHGGYWWMMNGVNTHVTDRTRAEAVQFLKEARPKDVPFALTVAFGPPKGGMQRHDTTPEFVDMYKHAFFPEPYNVTHAYSLLPWFLQNEKSEARLRYDYRWKGFGKVQEGMKTYFALMSQIDDACRQIIDVIKDQGLMDETMIIFTADNGEFHSSHGLSDKWYPYQESIRVPLIIYDPRIPPEKRGTLDESLVLNVDLAETILGAAGLPPDALMQGRDMADLYLPPNRPPFDRKKPRQEPWRNEFYYEFPSLSPDIEPSTALVRKEWKYIKWTERGYEQLFHLEHDPLEMYDLRNVSEFQSLVEIMRARHDQLQLEAMAPIIPGTQCDTLIPPKTQIQEWPECCCVGNHTENLSEFYFGK